MVLLALTGCGGGKSSTGDPAYSFTAGNWLVRGASTPWEPCAIYLRGAFAASGSTLSANGDFKLPSSFSTPNPGCASSGDTGDADLANVAFTGSIGSNNLTLTSPDLGSINIAYHAYSGSVITLNATQDSSTHFGGTYSLTAGLRSAADNGNVDGVLVASVTGNWDGSVTSAENTQHEIEIALVQSDNATTSSTATLPAGAFPLSGTLAVHGMPCFAYGSIDPTQSYIQGEILVLYADAGGATIALRGYLPGPPTATTLTVTSYSGGEACTEFGSQGSFSRGQ